MIKHIALITACLAFSTPCFGQDQVEKSFVKKRYAINGTASIEKISGETKLVFSEDFKTKNGPDLKVYLSKESLSTLSAQEVDESAVRLSVLKSHQGKQSYTIPASIDLSEYQSVVIQCEAYTVLWGGFDL